MTAKTGNPSSTVASMEDARTERYWRLADPAQRIVYSWLMGEDAPTGDPKPRNRTRAGYRKTTTRRERKPARPSRIAA